MSQEAVVWAIAQKGISASEFRVLMRLANIHSPGMICRPLQEDLVIDTELSDKTVRQSLKALEEKGFIKRERMYRSDGARLSTKYFLNFEASS